MAMESAEKLRGRLRVAVLMGGPSEEHDISLRSGSGVVEALKRRGWHATGVIIPKMSQAIEARDVARHELERCEANVVFIALHGAFGEDGTVQQLCDELQLAYTGSDAIASRCGMDKVTSKRRFERAGLCVPRWRAFDPLHDQLSEQLDGFSFPLVIKPARQGSSLGVSIVQEPELVPQAVAAAARYGSPVILEQWVSGRELTVGVLGEQALPVIEIRPLRQFFNYEAKYTTGATEYLVPAPLPLALAERIQKVGLDAHRAIGCRHLSRTDLILRQDETPVILEVNTIPGFTSTSLLPKAAACAGLSYDEVCDRLVLMAWQDRPATAPRREVPSNT